jgi:peroxiredoxin Q/BCP
MSPRTTPAVGAKAPSFALPDSNGKKHSLSQHAGRKVVVYFYPKDDTPGCTIEACDFRDHMGRLTGRGVDVIGISPDTSTSHARFANKYGLPFTLLADPDKAAVRAYGAWGQKNMYGKTVEGVIRSTYVIDEQGRVAHAWPNVKAQGHVDEVLAWLEVNPKLHAAADMASSVVALATARAKLAGMRASAAAKPVAARARKAVVKVEKQAAAGAKDLRARASKAYGTAKKDATKAAKSARKKATTMLTTARRVGKAAVKAAKAELKSVRAKSKARR